MLLLHLGHGASIRIGRLGTFAFPAGAYLYVGSALGPGGLAARVAHHARRVSAPHWHIDYLRRRAELVAVWHRAGTARREHEWAAALMRSPGATAPVARFGASDCGCAAHLVRTGAALRFAQFLALVGDAGIGCTSMRDRGRAMRLT
ncbi:MAG: GIY-YIG nuclease family protein [Burkholderiales bacterium]|nr:GIY-YIG nuclease family protein [Burkholderiales bacterium]